MWTKLPDLIGRWILKGFCVKMVVDVFDDQSENNENKMVPGYKMDALYNIQSNLLSKMAFL